MRARAGFERCPAFPRRPALPRLRWLAKGGGQIEGHRGKAVFAGWAPIDAFGVRWAAVCGRRSLQQIAVHTGKLRSKAHRFLGEMTAA